MQQLTNLVQLKIDRQKYSVASMRHCLSGLAHLQDLELHKCSVAAIIFEDCPQLTRLCIDRTAHSKLRPRDAVPVAACLAPLKQLKQLQLKNVQLSQLTNGFTATTGLTQLNISNVSAPVGEGCININISCLQDLKLLDISYSTDIFFEHVPPNLQVFGMYCCGLVISQYPGCCKPAG